MKRKTTQATIKTTVFITLIISMTLSQENSQLITPVDSLELQKSYIRDLVNQQKSEILKTSKSDRISKELEASQLRYLDSIAASEVKNVEKQKAPLKEAAKEYVPRKSAWKKTAIIGGLSAGAIAGVLVYFLTKGNDKGGEDSDITDKPPLHP